MRKSGTVPGECTSGQEWLTVRLAAGPKKKNPCSHRIGPYKGSVTSFRHGVMTHFMSRCHRRRSEHSNRCRQLCERKLRITKGRGHGCQVRWDLATKASTKRSAGDCCNIDQRQEFHFLRSFRVTELLLCQPALCDNKCQQTTQ